MDSIDSHSGAAHPDNVNTFATEVLDEALPLEKRRGRRRKIRLPLKIVQLNGRRVDWEGETRDVSSSGISFFTRQELAVGSAVAWAVQLPSRAPLVQIQCSGQVVRCLQALERPAENLFEIGVRMERHNCVMPMEFSGRGMAVASLVAVLAVEGWLAVYSGVQRLMRTA